MSSSRSRFATLRHRAGLVALALLLFVGGIFAGEHRSTSVSADSNLEDQTAWATFQQVWDLIQTQYVDPSSIDPNAMLYAATAGMVDALGDTGHSTFEDPLEVKTSDPSLSGQYVGIGVGLDYSGLLPRITEVFDGGPADKGGIQVGDQIAKINGTRLDGKSSSDVANLIRGDEGTKVTLTIQRAGVADFDVTLTRAKVTVDPVSWWMIGDDIAQIRFTEFDQGSGDEVRQAIKDANAAGATKFVLDLRNNGGGLVNEATNVGGAFMPEGSTMFQTEDRDGNVSNMTVQNGTDFNYPLVVLINSGTASAAEITAAAISESGVGTTVGDTTFGTGTVLNDFPMDDGSLLVLGVERWLTPSGKSIWHKGLDPQIAVSLADQANIVRPQAGKTMTSAELGSSGDTQLQKAVAILEQQTGSR